MNMSRAHEQIITNLPGRRIRPAGTVSEVDPSDSVIKIESSIFLEILTDLKFL